MTGMLAGTLDRDDVPVAVPMCVFKGKVRRHYALRSSQGKIR